MFPYSWLCFWLIPASFAESQEIYRIGWNDITQCHQLVCGNNQVFITKLSILLLKFDISICTHHINTPYIRLIKIITLNCKVSFKSKSN